MYIQITPETECTEAVAYLDGNLVAPSEADIQLCYLDGNFAPSNYNYIGGAVARLITKPPRLFKFKKAALVSVFFTDTLEQQPLYVLFDGNRQLVDNTMFHWTAGENCDGNQPARTVKPADFLFRRLQAYNVEDGLYINEIRKDMPLNLSPVPEPKITNDNYEASIYTDFVLTTGPVLLNQSIESFRQSNLAAYSKLFDYSVLDPVGSAAKIGSSYKQKSVMLGKPGLYNELGVEVPVTTLYGEPLKAHKVADRLVYSCDTYWLDPTNSGLNMAFSKYGISDGTGNLYGSNGEVIGVVDEYAHIVKAQKPPSIYADIDKASDYDTIVFYRHTGEHPELLAGPLQNPPPADKQLQTPYKYENILLRTYSEALAGQSVNYHISCDFKTTVAWEYTTEILEVISGQAVEFFGGHNLGPGKYVYGRYTKPKGTIVNNFVLCRAGYSYVNYQLIRNKVYDTYGLEPVHMDEVFLFDPRLLNKLPYSEDGLHITLKDHYEFRLKGLILFNDSIRWCVLDHLVGSTYLITKSQQVEDYKKLQNQALFVVIKNNKVLTK